MQDIPNYYERAIALLASQFQIAMPDGSKTNLQKMIYAILTEAQEIQNQEELLYTQRSLDTAEGVQLDGLGQILGLTRTPGESDEVYRQALQFQIFVNRSSGTPEEVMAILKFLTAASKIWYLEIYPAAYQMATDGLIFPDDPSDIVGAIQNSSPAGVEFIGVTATYGTNPFTFSSDPIDQQLFVAANPAIPSELSALQVDPGLGLENLFIQRGETVNPDFGGGFAEALGSYPLYTIDTTGAGQLAEIIMTNGSIPPAP